MDTGCVLDPDNVGVEVELDTEAGAPFGARLGPGTAGGLQGVTGSPVATAERSTGGPEQDLQGTPPHRRTTRNCNLFLLLVVFSPFQASSFMYSFITDCHLNSQGFISLD